MPFDVRGLSGLTHLPVMMPENIHYFNHYDSLIHIYNTGVLKVLNPMSYSLHGSSTGEKITDEEKCAPTIGGPIQCVVSYRDQCDLPEFLKVAMVAMFDHFQFYIIKFHITI